MEALEERVRFLENVVLQIFEQDRLKPAPGMRDVVIRSKLWENVYAARLVPKKETLDGTKKEH